MTLFPAPFADELTSGTPSTPPRRRASRGWLFSRATAVAPVPLPHRLRATFWYSFWLLVVFAVMKIASLGLAHSPLAQGVGQFFHDLLMATAADGICAGAIGLLGTIALLATVRWPKVHRRVWAAWVGLCILFAIYAILSFYVFAYTRTPLNRRLLITAGDGYAMLSSINEYLTLESAIAVIGGPLAYWFLARWCHRRTHQRHPLLFSAAAVILISLVSAQSLLAAQSLQAWMRRSDHRINQNPHWTLIASYLLPDDPKFILPADVPAAYAQDFAPIRERPNIIRSSRSSLLAADVRPPKHVIIFVLESVSTQHLGVYGSRYDTTPTLNALAGNALVFNNIYSHVGMTASALVAITSGNYPRTVWQDGHYPDVMRPLWQPGTLLGEVLKKQGFRTLVATSSDLLFNHQRSFLEGRGYDDLWDKRHMNTPEVNTWGTSDKRMVERTLEWIDQDKASNYAKPFHAICWTNQTHHPYFLSKDQAEIDFCKANPPGGTDTLNRYLNCLREMDRNIALLIEGLKQRGLAEDTLVIVTGDHGEGFNWPHDSLGHGFRIYQENLNVPCIFWNPRLFPRGKRVETIGSHIDLSATITDILGIPPAPTWQGHSLLDTHHPGRAYFYGANNDVLLGLREGPFKYIYNATTGYDELYNLAADPLEQNDLSEVDGTHREEMRKRVGAWAKYIEQHGAGVTP